MNKKRNFVWLGEWSDLTADFTTNQLGKLLRMVQQHVDGDEPKPSKDKEVAMAYRFIAGGVDRSMDKYVDICQKREKAARERWERQKREQEQANEYNSMQMDTSVPNSNPNPNPNPNSSPNPIPNPNPNPNPNPTPHKGVGVLGASAREDEGFDPYETYGCINNVKMSPEQYRHLVEEFGEQAVNEVVDDLSCKLADGNAESHNHYATIRSWLSYRRRNDTGSVPMSNNSTTTETEEQKCRRIWAMMKKEDQEQHLKDNDGLYPWEDPRYNKSLIQQDYGNAK